jgi:polyisoprenoid-binding protein YceI
MARYHVLPDRSSLTIEARSTLHPIRLDVRGVRGEFDADVRDGKATLPASASGEFSLETARLRSGNPLYDAQLERRLEARRYPWIRGRVREAAPVAGRGGYRVRGDLSLHGVTQRVEGEARLRVVDARTIEVEAEQVLDVRDFGLPPPRLLVLRVEPRIHVRGRIVATATAE